MSRHSLKIQIASLALLAALGAVTPAAARVFVPTTTNDDADGSCDIDCSLRDAVTAANQSPGFDAIVLGPGIYQLSVILPANEDLNAAGDLDIADDLAILGASAERTGILGSTDRVLDVQAGATVEIAGVTIGGGRVPSGSGNGGGIRNAGHLTLTRVQLNSNQATAGSGGGIFSGGASSSLTIAQSTIFDNQAASAGGGIALDGDMTLTDSTVSGNIAGTQGGGIYAFSDSDAEIANSTITANQSTLQGGGLYAASQPFQSTQRPILRNTILARNNSPSSADRDCAGAPGSAGHNVLGVGGTCIDFTAAKADKVGTEASPLDPKLGPLDNYGGTTRTFSLLAGSPALNAGSNCTPADQRGVARPAACDIGAFELDTTVCLTGGPTLCLNAERFKVTVSFKTAQGTGDGQAVELTPDSGYFWFFDPNNVELTVKVLNGCGVNQRYWVFAAGMTNVEVTLKVTDTVTGQTKTYTNPQGRVFRTITDTTAFASCG